MAGWLNLVNEWLVRGLVLLSLAAHILLILFAGIRRRNASGGRRAILWLAYQLADWVATFSIGKLFLGSTSREQQLAAFWLPFLLIHLGRPDNINAYSLEDNALSARQVVEAITQVVGAGYALYNHIIIGGGGGTFLVASVIMFFVGIIKYLGRIVALWQADLGSIRSSGIKSRPAPSVPSFRPGCLDSEQVLLVAHDLFHITEGAFADYSSVDEDPLNPRTKKDRWPYGWQKMRKVVEMELSIMYDILYTKAKWIHTWRGYVFRAAWPFFTLSAFWLFWFCNKDGLRRADIYITYTLLAATFLLDMGWLLRALVSAGTYAFLNDSPGLRHLLLCTRRWHWLRRVVVSDLVNEPTSCRMWSGRIGQYNLLHECTHETTSLLRTPAKYFKLEDRWKDYQYHHSRGLDIPPCVRELLFERIWVKLKLAYEEKEPPLQPTLPICPQPTWQPWRPPDADLRRRDKLDEALGFDPELQVNILAWHIATDVFLLCSEQDAASCTRVKTIKALSDYMVFLVAVRPYMLPGRKLSSLHKATSDALQGIWRDKKKKEQELASILQEMEMEMEQPDLGRKRSPLYDKSVILSDGTRIAKWLLGWQKCEDELKIRKEVGIGDNPSSSEGASDKVLDCIFDWWVLMLIYVSTRCSRESHAKQLSRGGELTTIVWILAEHAGVFGIHEHTRGPTDEHTPNSGVLGINEVTRSPTDEHTPCSVM